MNVEVQELSPCQKKLTIQLSAEEVNKEFQAVLRNLRQNVAIPGFRKGKASISTIKRRFGKELKNDVKEHLLEHSLKDALIQQNISPVGTPSLDVKSITVAENQPVTYDVEVEFIPPVEITDYTGIEVPAPKAQEVSEDQVTQTLKGLQRQHAVSEPTDDDHIICDNDSVTIDYDRKLDGESLGDPVKNYTVWLGVDAIPPDLHNGLLGKKKGEHFSFTMPYGNDTENPAIAGKTLEFEVDIVSVETMILPDIDDEFAKDLEQETLEALKQKITADIRAKFEQDALDANKQLVLMKLAERYQFEVPPSLLKEQKQNYPQKDEEELKKMLRAGIILAKVQNQENMTVSEDELNARIQQLATHNQMAVAAMRSYLESRGGLERVRRDMLETKALDFLYAQATIVEGA